MSFCHKCGFEYPSDSLFCPKCGTPVRAAEPFQQPVAKPEKKSSILWWVAPILLLIVGGFLAYRANRRDNKGAARKQLVLGIAMTVIVPLLYITFVFVSRMMAGLP